MSRAHERHETARATRKTEPDGARKSAGGGSCLASGGGAAVAASGGAGLVSGGNVGRLQWRWWRRALRSNVLGTGASSVAYITGHARTTNVAHTTDVSRATNVAHATDVSRTTNVAHTTNFSSATSVRFRNRWSAERRASGSRRKCDAIRRRVSCWRDAHTARERDDKHQRSIYRRQRILPHTSVAGLRRCQRW